jgi:hypothetical protein
LNIEIPAGTHQIQSVRPVPAHSHFPLTTCSGRKLCRACGPQSEHYLPSAGSGGRPSSTQHATGEKESWWPPSVPLPNGYVQLCGHIPLLSVPPRFSSCAPSPPISILHTTQHAVVVLSWMVPVPQMFRRCLLEHIRST